LLVIGVLGVGVGYECKQPLRALPKNSPYSAMKRALASISLTAREELKQDDIVVSVVYPYVTLTDFEKNAIKDPSLPQEEPDEGSLPFPADTAEYAAQKILEGVENGEPEIFAHDWMKNIPAGNH
jgi:short-subunit dehydrogenase